MEAAPLPPTIQKIQGVFVFFHHYCYYYSCRQQSALFLKPFVPPPFVILSQVSAEPEGGSYVFQGFVQGKDYGRFGLQRVGTCGLTGRRVSGNSFVCRVNPSTLSPPKLSSSMSVCGTTSRRLHA